MMCMQSDLRYVPPTELQQAHVGASAFGTPRRAERGLVPDPAGPGRAVRAARRGRRSGRIGATGDLLALRPRRRRFAKSVTCM